MTSVTIKKPKTPFQKSCTSDKLFIITDVMLLLLIFVVIVYPLLYVVASSFSGGEQLNGLSLIPREFSLEGYKAVFEYGYVWSGYWNSIYQTVIGTAVAMVVTILCAYPLSRADFRPGKVVSALCVFTMYFNGGLIPTYLWIRNLGMINSIWAVLLPASLSVYNMIVMRTYFNASIPGEMRESAQIDGCGEWRYLLQIVLPLSGSVLAVVALYYAVARWNGYFEAMVYLQDKDKWPLQNILREIIVVNINNTLMGDAEMEARAAERAELLKYSMIVLGSLPMMLLYPFVQKFFVKGVMIGAVKG